MLLHTNRIAGLTRAYSTHLVLDLVKEMYPFNVAVKYSHHQRVGLELAHRRVDQLQVSESIRQLIFWYSRRL